MPRDFARMATEDALQDMHPLTKSPDPVADGGDSFPNDDRATSSFLGATGPPPTKRDELHPYTQTLTLSDVESCTRLEEATFPASERCTREKFEYRFKACGELTLGIFTSYEGDDIPTSQSSAPVYSGAPQRKAVLLGHIVSTKTTNPTVTDDDMNYPTPSNPDPRLGHKENGRTICLHSLAVLPDFQRRGLASTLVKAYIDRLETQDVADRVALLTHEDLIPFYERHGFECLGKSHAQYGDGGWYDMVRNLHPISPGQGVKAAV